MAVFVQRSHNIVLIVFSLLRTQNETALMALFSEFLRQISQVYQSRSTEGKKYFLDRIGELSSYAWGRNNFRN